MDDELFKKTYPYICRKCRQFAHSYYEYCEKCGSKDSLKKARRIDYGFEINRKKVTAIVILTVFLGASFIFNIILGTVNSKIENQEKNTLIIGYTSNPVALDPVDTWDHYSHNIQRQVTQSLVEYDLSTHPNYQLKPVLSEYWVWENRTRISFKLRENVYFHDKTRMTAEDVKWNFERIKWFCNATGDLPANETSWKAFPSSLYFLANGTYIFKSFEANDTIDPLNFTINLNSPFSALLDLLTSGGTNILSPESTPKHHYLNLETEILVGTGPYRYIHFRRDEEVRLERNNMYWAFPGYFEIVIFRVVEDDTARMTSGLTGQFHYITGVSNNYIDTYKADDDFHVEDVGEDLCYFYLEIYCGPKDYDGTLLTSGSELWQYQRNNATLRRAIALAINYTFIYEEILNGYAVEGPPVVPRGMPGHNASVEQASDSRYTWEENIEKARDLMKKYNPVAAAWDSSYPGTDESLWSGANLLGRSLDFKRYFGSTSSLKLSYLLTINLDLIGVKIGIPIEWDDYFDFTIPPPWEIDLIFKGWCPDYLNPYIIVDPLFNLQSESCYSRVNDTSPGGLTDMMRNAITEVNRTKQFDIYGNIQSYIFDINRPLTPASHAHISGWVYKVQQVHMSDLKGVNYNVMKMIECWDWYKDD